MELIGSLMAGLPSANDQYADAKVNGLPKYTYVNVKRKRKRKQGDSPVCLKAEKNEMCYAKCKMETFPPSLEISIWTIPRPHSKKNQKSAGGKGETLRLVSLQRSRKER